VGKPLQQAPPPLIGTLGGCGEVADASLRFRYVCGQRTVALLASALSDRSTTGRPDQRVTEVNLAE
jgi:hypothetical protein